MHTGQRLERGNAVEQGAVVWIVSDFAGKDQEHKLNHEQVKTEEEMPKCN